jgi:DNA-binding NarL/FixJ family response regulator
LYRIFIVEDHPLMRETYHDIVSYEPDMEVCGVAASGEEALERLAQVPADVVIADLSLPGMNGYDLTRHLRADHPDLPVLIVSGHSANQYQEMARGHGAAAYVDKMDAPDTLIPTIRSVLDR